MESSERRKAANEIVFREVNERIEALGRRFTLTEDEPLRLVCECDRLTCAEPLELSFAQYERLRSDPTQFVVLDGHEDLTVEDVVDTGPNYLVVRKHSGEAADLARAHDPRG